MDVSYREERKTGSIMEFISYIGYVGSGYPIRPSAHFWDEDKTDGCKFAKDLANRGKNLGIALINYRSDLRAFRTVESLIYRTILMLDKRNIHNSTNIESYETVDISEVELIAINYLILSRLYQEGYCRHEMIQTLRKKFLRNF